MDVPVDRDEHPARPSSPGGRIVVADVDRMAPRVDAVERRAVGCPGETVGEGEVVIEIVEVTIPMDHHQTLLRRRALVDLQCPDDETTSGIDLAVVESFAGSEAQNRRSHRELAGGRARQDPPLAGQDPVARLRHGDRTDHPRRRDTFLERDRPVVVQATDEHLPLADVDPQQALPDRIPHRSLRQVERLLGGDHDGRRLLLAHTRSVAIPPSTLRIVPVVDAASGEAR